MAKKISSTWSASLLRCTIQVACMIIFLVLFFYVCWPYGSQNYSEKMRSKEFIDAEIFLALDPLLSISTTLAGKVWIWSLSFTLGIVLIGIIFPNSFCGYICPFGTLIDLFDWAFNKRIVRTKIKRNGWWTNLKYYILSGVLLASIFGILLSGSFSSITVVTRGMLFLFSPLQMGLSKGWHLIPKMNAGHYISLILFFAILFLGLLRPRFWCCYVCPTGAVFSVSSLLRINERKVEKTCVSCGRCAEICPFDAIKTDYATKTTRCTFCKTCKKVCPTHSIKFVSRWNKENLKPKDEFPANEISPSRRGFLFSIAGASVAILGIKTVFGANLKSSANKAFVRPPGSVPEQKFLQMCIRCGECIKACPNNVLQPMSFEQGIEGIWVPKVVADWSGCEPTCNNCGQVCPTGAIRKLPIEEKRVARMGLANVNKDICLPFAGQRACQFCVDECISAGYNAIEFMQVHTKTDDNGMPIEGTGYLAPVVLQDKCVGCGLCQTRCYNINVKEKHLIPKSAIQIEAGYGKEDRIMKGSYIQLRDEELKKKQEGIKKQIEQKSSSDDYLPDFLK